MSLIAIKPDARTRRYEALFEAHYGAIRPYCLRRTDEHTARDAVSDTFLVAWRRLEDLPEDPLPYLYGVARRALADQHRSARRRSALAERAAAEPPGPAPDVAEGVAERDAVRAAMETLNDADRETLALVAWEELDSAGAAEAAGVSRSTFAVRLFRARRRLAAALEEGTR